MNTATITNTTSDLAKSFEAETGQNWVATLDTLGLLVDGIEDAKTVEQLKEELVTIVVRPEGIYTPCDGRIYGSFTEFSQKLMEKPAADVLRAVVAGKAKVVRYPHVFDAKRGTDIPVEDPQDLARIQAAVHWLTHCA